jgi:methyl-accepting chemotaxis protein
MDSSNDKFYFDLNISKQHEEKLKDLDSGINILLDEFKKVYVITRMNPNNQEYQQQFQSITNSLAEILSKLFVISNDVQVNIDDINKNLFELNELIENERIRNRELKRKLGMIENTSNASSEMISDYKNIYNYNYLRNWSLLISSLLCIGAIGIIYKQRV